MLDSNNNNNNNNNNNLFFTAKAASWIQSRAILRIQLEQYIKYTRNIFTIDKYKKHYLQLRRKIRKKYIRKENQRSDL